MSFDWIDEFLSATDNLRAPPSFRLWAAISTIAATLERRVWTETDMKPLFPNQYIILAGGPASGKTVSISFAKDLLIDISTEHGGLFLGPDNPTKASFLDQMEKSQKQAVNGMGIPWYSAMYVMCMEFGVLISKYEKDFIADLTTLYDNPSIYTAPRRVSSSITLEAPTVNIIAAATPDALGDTIPEVAWNQGFTSRFLFIHGTRINKYRDPFRKGAARDFKKLRIALGEFFHDLHGEFEWTEEAQAALKFWLNDEEMTPVPTYSRLVHYIGRRNEHVMKLAMISAVSAGNGLTVELSDFYRAKSWLLEAEKTMPDVFRSMAQKSDIQLISDCHYHFYTIWSTASLENRRSFKPREVYKWFEDKAPQERIDGLIQLLEKTGRFRQSIISGEWIPSRLDQITDDV